LGRAAPLRARRSQQTFIGKLWKLSTEFQRDGEGKLTAPRAGLVRLSLDRKYAEPPPKTPPEEQRRKKT
jgi:hypothetical protein